MKAEITCLCCGGQDFQNDHQCPVQSPNGRVLKIVCRGRHRGFCQMCRLLMDNYFEGQMSQKRLPSADDGA